MTARILVVDDDPAVAEMIGIVLRADGFETEFCDHGDRALDIFQGHASGCGAARPDAAWP